MDPKIDSKLLQDLISFVKDRKSDDPDIINGSYEYFGNEDDAYEFGFKVADHQSAEDLESILMKHGLITEYVDPE